MLCPLIISINRSPLCGLLIMKTFVVVEDNQIEVLFIDIIIIIIIIFICKNVFLKINVYYLCPK